MGRVSRVGQVGDMMNKAFWVLAAVTALMFAYAPVAIAGAPYESTMLLVQKIFYFHFSTWMALTAAVVICGTGSAIYLFKGSATADRLAFAAAELTVVFGAFGLVSGSLWARKAWGHWWQWDNRLTMALLLELVFIGYLLVRKYGGGNLRGCDGAVRVQVRRLVAHHPPEDERDALARHDVAGDVAGRVVLHVRVSPFVHIAAGRPGASRRAPRRARSSVLRG